MIQISDVKHSFFAWIDKAVTDKHLHSGNAKYMKEKFGKTIEQATAQTIQKEQENFTAWLDKIEKQGHVTKGNVSHTKKKIATLLSQLSWPSTAQASSNSAKKSSNVELEIFQDWADKAKKQGHFTEGNVTRIKSKAQELFTKHATATAAKEFMNWAQRAERDGHFTSGNVQHMQAKMDQLFPAAGHSSPSQSSSSQSSSSHNASSNNSSSSAPQPASVSSVAQRDGFLYFYNQNNALTAFLGNFYPCSITYNGLTFSCSEAAFQAAKFNHMPSLQQALCKLDGDGAWRYAQKHKAQQRNDWLQVNVTEMKNILLEKFKDPALKKLLVETGDAYLVEHTPVKGRDVFWADDCDGTGKNMLGQLLMQVRQECGGHGLTAAPQKYQQFIQGKKT
jgi:ribA/ribD-fused uncharacterized protein